MIDLITQIKGYTWFGLGGVFQAVCGSSCYARSRSVPIFMEHLVHVSVKFKKEDFLLPNWILHPLDCKLKREMYIQGM